MRDVDDVEQPEGHRDAEAHRGVEPAEQDACHERIEEELEREHGLSAHGTPGHAATAARPGLPTETHAGDYFSAFSYG
jgi:hypothetical protein